MMGSLVEVHRWLGQVAAPLDPSAMQFRAKLAAVGVGDCAGCVFRGQSANVCKVAANAARLAGMKDCDEHDAETDRTFVYTLAPTDPRQYPITAGEQP